ncbi:hypothetical protein E2F46_16665 [Luteimonas aestuarii]|uniref:Toxic anion resistance protein n=1 Tax=Luteimonas aestuarii TaxID=453837 RepID=A0A4R5TQF8_9GAMM|nr:hypothetical protein [Luteimonas aestuarii]TDK19560.1 hypothetical protein E2F46_16665 [Luteimonas aestuarii]
MNGDRAPVDLDDPLAVVGYGGDAVDAALDARLTDALDGSAAAALVARLQTLQRALQAGKPREIRRGTGLIGRLLGRDVEAEAEARALQQRLGVLMTDTDRGAAALRTRVAAHHALQETLAGSIARIADRHRAARDWLDANPLAGADAPAGGLAPRARLEDRLAHLRTVQSTWELGARQLQLLHQQHLDLLARYQRIRDVLLPVWQQHALALASTTGAAQAATAADAQAAIESEVAAMAAKLD